jgi:hypothetical protein
MRTKPSLAGLLSFAFAVLLPAFLVHAYDQDRASVGEWIALTLIVAALIAVVIIAPILWRRDANPHTGLPSKIKTDRFRGPLTRIRG